MCIVNISNMPLLRHITTHKTTNEIDGCKKLLHICCIWLQTGMGKLWIRIEKEEGCEWGEDKEECE